MSKTRRVILQPEQSMILYNELLSTTATDRRTSKALDAIDEELGKIVGAHTTDLTGNVKFKRPESTAEVEFSFNAMLGAKIILVQAIAGLGRSKAQASYGYRKYSLMPVVTAFGKKMVEVIEEETKLKDGSGEEVDWNEDLDEGEGDDGSNPEGNGNPEAAPASEPAEESVSS